MKTHQINNKEVAGKLKGVIAQPEWAEFVRTGVSKERLPDSKDWWYERAASVLYKVDRLGPIGTNKLRSHYGGRKNRGVKPDKFKKGSGNIVRKILQQLEAAGFVKQAEVQGHKGRILTKQGLELIKNGKHASKQEKKTDKVEQTN